METKQKKKLFISGPITGTDDYRERFREAREFYERQGCAVMSPADLPAGMSNADYMRCCLAMIDTADEVVLLPGWHDSVGSRLEHDYCYYTRKKKRLYADDRELGTPYSGWKDDCDRAAMLYRWLSRRDRSEEAGRVSEYLSTISRWKYDTASVACLRREMGIDALLEENELWRAKQLMNWTGWSDPDHARSKLWCYMRKIPEMGDDTQVQVLRELYGIEALEEEYISAEDRTEEAAKEWKERREGQREKLEQDDEEVTIKGTIDLTDLAERFFSFGKTGHDFFDDVMDFAVGQALDRGYGVDFSRDADGWRCITLRAPLPKEVFAAKCEEDDTKERGSLWVSVDDKLPKHGEDVLVHYSDSVCNNKMGVGWYGRMGSLSEQWTVFGSAGTPRVTAWTKLPPMPPTVKTEA